MAKDEPPFVSAIMPTYNSAAYVLAAVRSVQLQTFPNWELIVVDDCSSDGSASIIRELCETDARIRFHKTPVNGGAALARNIGIELARARYLAFLDSDDQWEPDKLRQQLEFMRAQKSPFSCTAYVAVSEANGKQTLRPVPARATYTDLLKHNSVGCSTVMLDASAFGQVRMPPVRKSEDLGLWLKLLKRVSHVDGLNMPLTRYGVRSNSVSGNKMKAALGTWKLYRHVERLPAHQAIYYFVQYAWNALNRKRSANG